MSSTIETGHADNLNDIQVDYYGKRIATASSDKTIRIFETSDNNEQYVSAELKYHEGPVFQVAWAHPQFGTYVASCSYDKRVVVWKEEQPGHWGKAHEYAHTASVNSVAWAPASFGQILAAASADGTISTHSFHEGKWIVQTFRAHNGGANSVSWCPASSLASQGQTKRFVSGGCDNRIKIWRFEESQQQWYDESKFDESKGSVHHKGWVREAAWSPSTSPTNTIASCSEDHTVAIWSESRPGVWRKSAEIKLSADNAQPSTNKVKAYRVTWSPVGDILAISQSDHKVTFWKDSGDGNWRQVDQGKLE